MTNDIKTDDYALPRRQIAALRGLSMNNNITVTPSDKGAGVFITDSTHYNNKEIITF